MKFREALKIIEGLRFIADNISLMSALGQSCIMDSDFITEHEALEKEYDYLATSINTLKDPRTKDTVDEIRHLLMQARDIRTTIKRLEENSVLDDVEFFEIKGLSILSKEIGRLMRRLELSKFTTFDIPDLGKVTEILDPEKTANTHFHIYDAYSEELAQKRQQLKKLQAAEGSNTEETDSILAECMMIESRIREDLSKSLQPYAGRLHKALLTIGKIDLLLAKAHFAMQFCLAIPNLTQTYIHFTGLRYLPVEESLKKANKEFQAIDVSLNKGVTVITGANMGGKTITLKSLAMAQAMAQFAFGVPAKKGGTIPVSKIALSIGDSQSAAEGLSSFGAEILKIDGILTEAAADDRMLILIDEPARTTNPEEGKAIVSAIIEILMKYSSISVLTTHYSIITAGCTRLKVKGVRDNLPNDGKELLPGSLTDYMDYSLVRDERSEVDREALTIARMIGISENFSQTIENNLIP